jgi:hypothetical protein
MRDSCYWQWIRSVQSTIEEHFVFVVPWIQQFVVIVPEKEGVDDDFDWV